MKPIKGIIDPAYRQIIMALLFLAEYGGVILNATPEQVDKYPDHSEHTPEDLARAKFIAEQQGRIRMILSHIECADFQASIDSLVEAINKPKPAKLSLDAPIIFSHVYRTTPFGPN